MSIVGDVGVSRSYYLKIFNSIESMYRIERKFGVFSKLDACTFVVNVYDEGKILSIVTDSSPHGTHVAGIATAFHPKVPSDNLILCLSIRAIFFLFI